jgi:8-oxo-dGTP pyrophosphatase MutT (NUDIX family)
VPAEDRRLIRQYGVIPFRRGEEVEILLITSRETKRWVVPRGNPISGLSPPEAAAQEAFEEAGVRGIVAGEPFGSYRYGKRRTSGVTEEALVDLFPLQVEEILDDWPERSQRERRWFAAEDAAASVAEDDLAALIRRFGEAGGR